MEQFGPDDQPQASYEYIILGRVPVELAEKYHNWIGAFREDQGVYTKFLKILNLEEYERRKSRFRTIWSSERADMISYQIRPVVLDPNNFMKQIRAAHEDRAAGIDPLADLKRWSSSRRTGATSARSDTPASHRVRIADPRQANERAYELSQELFGEDSDDEQAEASGDYQATYRFGTPARGPPSELGWSGNRVVGFDAVTRATPVSRRLSPTSQLSPQFAVGRRIPTPARTPEMERLLALRNTRALPDLGRNGSTPSGGNGATGNEIGGGVFPPGSGIASRTPSNRNRQPGGSDLSGARSRRESPGVGGTRLTEELNQQFAADDMRHSGVEGHTAAWIARNSGPQGVEASMLRMALASETNNMIKTQAELFKDMGLASFLHYVETLLMPAVGVAATLLPSLYHVFGITGHIANTTPGSTGAQRYRLISDYVYQIAPFSAPSMLSRISVKLHPRLIIVLSFVMFRGPMAFHPSDICVVSRQRPLDMGSTEFHLSGKSLPASGLAKLTPPDLSNFSTSHSSLWEQLEHFVNLFSLLYGEGHRVPLTTLVLDLKDICKLDLGLTAYQTANLFARTLGFHQTQILNAFGSADGTLSHIKTMDDFLAELSSSASEEDLLARIPPWPRLAPGVCGQSTARRIRLGT